MLRLSALLERLSSAARRLDGAARDAARARRGTSRRRAKPARRPVLLEQLVMDLGPARPRWTFSRLAARSPHHARIVERLEQVRRFFPELAGVAIHVGLAQKPGILGWGSLDPERPGVWVRPRRLHLFTIAHEFTHLLQARGLVPGGERACDLFALARSPLLIDHAPGYLRVPPAMRRRTLTADDARRLHAAATRALAAREAGERRYLTRFERELADEAARG
ncbi:MAG TPA: hypothetical protein VMH61_06325 [Candidatus Acidoferrales bacterium]|nr:hypothetical protein [Candidatus Acidoferrales bacterium]